MKPYKKINIALADRIADGLNELISCLVDGEYFTKTELRDFLKMTKTPYYTFIPNVFCSKKGNSIIKPSPEISALRKGGRGERVYNTFMFATDHVTGGMISSSIVKMNDSGIFKFITDIPQPQPKPQPKPQTYSNNVVLVQNGDSDLDISKVADGVLIAELRSRGIDVVATKKVEVVTTKTITF